MPARQRHHVSRGPRTGAAGTAAAYQLCARPGCGDARIRHATFGPCAATHWAARHPDQDGDGATFTLCQCPRFVEPPRG